jgi:hypothetical protein
MRFARSDRVVTSCHSEPGYEKNEDVERGYAEENGIWR